MLTEPSSFILHRNPLGLSGYSLGRFVTANVAVSLRRDEAL